MARYAKGKRSYGMSDRGGHRVRYTQLKTTWDGLRVSPDEWEPKHPQLTPPKNVIDATALFKPRPSSDAENVTIFIAHTFDPFADPRTRKTVGVAGYGNTNRVDNELHTRMLIDKNRNFYLSIWRNHLSIYLNK